MPFGPLRSKAKTTCETGPAVEGWIPLLALFKREDTLKGTTTRNVRAKRQRH